MLVQLVAAGHTQLPQEIVIHGLAEHIYKFQDCMILCKSYHGQSHGQDKEQLGVGELLKFELGTKVF